MIESIHIQWMRRAMEMADKAEEQGEVPVGAVIIQNEKVISTGMNAVISSHDPTAHAEIQAIRAAGQVLDNYRLVNTTLYVTLEPCPMCLGAIMHARIGAVIFGASDPKSGACGGADDLTMNQAFFHKLNVEGPIMQDECADQLTSFFKTKRNR